ncbi:glycoside hydrolase family 55 protein [Pseudocercospora fijiensis CIRAD86]|uniref:Glycoside hydrolase family 55 protein n=1 Tax=Pseudocercospora fijiensis (strain CIRAD86) TaxID=383855 RepID=N1Q6U4_PSEFD|nr:glycoside hydrolase family 55 protein [Pseudocercospora fijiensis CIRAD86]EME87161.1 glycoside hydrolase family 55 protein [Pseudocercospora fijiensis CIRAD86]
MLSFLQSLICVSSFFCFTTAQQQYLEPAPAYVIKPDPTVYQDWTPKNPGHGDFSDRNSSVTPWQPVSHRPRPYSTPSVCGVQSPAKQSQYWLPNLPARLEGFSPFLVDGRDYKVFRNVKDYGAKGDGETDDTDAFNRAISDQSRMAGGMGRGGSTGQPALIYIPPGTYIISSTVQLFIGTQVMGDAIHMPTIKASSIMRNDTHMFSGFDFGQPSTTNFYIGLRNVMLDTSGADPNETIYALNWAVSQATNLINVNFNMPKGSKHIGLTMDGHRGGGNSGGGSGLFMGDLTFTGGLIGVIFNNQQYAFKNLKFQDVATGIAVRHAFTLTMQEIHCINVGICVDMGGIDVTGSIALIDSICETCGVVVNGTSTIILENIVTQNSGPTLKVNGTARSIGSLVGRTYALGHVYKASEGNATNTNGTFLPYTTRGSLTASDGRYFNKRQPQYLDYPISAFASIKDAGARGDGVTDDTAAIQQALVANANCKITYFPHGIYLVTDTIYIPPGSRIVGQVWSTITASGPKFSSETSPRPMLQVGKPGETGLVEVTDMLFTVSDMLPGTILVQVNMAGTKAGDVSFHNTHFRIGGAVDSRLRTSCQEASKPCKAAFLLLHLSPTSSSYWENSWFWTADHDLDGEFPQNIATGRGVLIQAKKGTWLVGTGSEHHTLYAYQFENAQNVFAALLQVETPYWQPSPRAPAPWVPNATWQDPDFSGCEGGNVSQCYMAWALRIFGEETRTLPLYGHGFWTFFNGPNYGGCEAGPEGNCQVNVVDLRDLRKGNGVELYNLNTKGVQNMVTLGGVQLLKRWNSGSWGAVVAAYLGFE